MVFDVINKLYIYGAGLLILWFLYSQFTGLIEDNATQETEISNLKDATDILGKELINRSNINIKLAKAKIEIEKQNRELKNDLTKIKTTPQQAKCDVTDLPNGYLDRLLKY